MRTFESLDSLDKSIVSFVSENPGCKTHDILASLENSVNQSTLSRRMSALISDSYISREGKGKNTIYYGNDLLVYLSQDAGKRPESIYNYEFLMNFNPETDHFFSNKELKEMEEAGRLNEINEGNLNSKVQSLYEQFSISLSYESSRLEGNTYDYIDTEVLLKYGQKASGKSLEDAQMILNHRDAIDYQFKNLDNIDVDIKTIKDVHALLSHDLRTVQPDEEGAFRKRSISIGGSSYKPMEIPYQLPEQMALFADKASIIENPFEKSLFTMATISYIQAFIDVNKRTGRLMANVPLMKNGLCPLSFRDMDKEKYVKGLLGFYELNRMDLLKEAYKEAYIKSVPDMKKHVSNAVREVNPVGLEFRREVNAAVKGVVECRGKKSTNDILSMVIDKQVTDDQKSQLIEIVEKKISVLGENQLVIYGIDKSDFDLYKKSN